MIKIILSSHVKIMIGSVSLENHVLFLLVASSARLDVPSFFNRIWQDMHVCDSLDSMHTINGQVFGGHVWSDSQWQWAKNPMHDWLFQWPCWLKFVSSMYNFGAGFRQNGWKIYKWYLSDDCTKTIKKIIKDWNMEF